VFGGRMPRKASEWWMARQLFPCPESFFTDVVMPENYRYLLRLGLQACPAKVSVHCGINLD